MDTDVKYVFKLIEPISKEFDYISLNYALTAISVELELSSQNDMCWAYKKVSMPTHEYLINNLFSAHMHRLFFLLIVTLFKVNKGAYKTYTTSNTS